MLYIKTSFHTIETSLLFIFDQDRSSKTKQKLLMRFQELVIHGTGYSHYPLANIFIIMAFAKKYKNKCPLYHI